MMADPFYKQTTLPTASEKADPPLPDRIGPYIIEALLAKGSRSLLYLGVDSVTKKPCALKVLSPEFVNHPEMVDHFLWEAKVIALTNHPNIVKLYGQGTWEGGVYIAMEFIRGVSLRQFLMQQSFSLKRSLSIVLQIAYALSHLHSHGVIHRDLKPENILIAEDGEVRVIDFGIAQLHEEKKQPSALSGMVVGTPSYMSPEQKESPFNITYASDIYALGVITYELILGKLSYGLINLSLLPPKLQTILGKALAVSLQERYTDIIDFITDITQYYKSPEIEKERPGSDQVLEYLEVLQRAELSLSAKEAPHWPHIEVGLAKQRLVNQMGLYLDFFKFANNTFGIVLAQTFSTGLVAPLMLAHLKGLIRPLLDPPLTDPKIPFSPSKLATSLNNLILQDRLKERFYLSLLKLIPLNDGLIFLSCGTGPLLHLPQGSKQLRRLSNDNPLIGQEPTATFTETSDNWREGDQLFLHCLEAALTSEHSPLDQALHKAIQETALFSPARSAEAILKELASLKEFQEIKHPKALLNIQRIS